MLAAVEQQKRQQRTQPQPSPNFTAEPAQTDFVVPSQKRARSTETDPPSLPAKQPGLSFQSPTPLSSPPPPPVLPPQPSSHAASPVSASLFGDDAIFEGILQNATFARRDSHSASPPSSHRSAPAPELAGFLPCRFAQPPLDWSLSSRVRFTCNRPLLCVQPTQEVLSDALRAFVLRAASPSAPSDGGERSAAVTFASSLLHYSFPQPPLNDRHPLTTHVLNALSTPSPSPYDRRCIAFLAQRWAEWEQSLRSLYYQLRTRRVHHFYVVSAQHTALFLAATSANAALPSAILSRSTAAIRNALSGLGVRYHAPYAKPTEAKPALTEAEVGRLPKGVKLVAPSEKRDDDGQLSSLLVLSGREDVHGLFDFLLNADRRSDDVPTLLCSAPFLHSTLSSLVVTPSSKPPSDSPELHAASEQSLCTVEVAGWVLPEALVGMVGAVREEMAQREWSVRLWKEDECAGSASLNTVMSVQAMGDCAGAAAAGVALCHDEHVHAALLRTAPNAGINQESPAVSAIRYAAGEFHVQLRPG